MNRKLQHTFLALSAAGLVAIVGLVAATSGVLTPAPPPTVHAFATSSAVTRADAVEARIRAFEAEVAGADSTNAILGATTAIAVELAMAKAFGKDAEAAVDADAADRQRRKTRRSRGAMAMPYFSFAPSLRGGNGG